MGLTHQHHRNLNKAGGISDRVCRCNIAVSPPYGSTARVKPLVCQPDLACGLRLAACGLRHAALALTGRDEFHGGCGHGQALVH